MCLSVIWLLGAQFRSHKVCPWQPILQRVKSLLQINVSLQMVAYCILEGEDNFSRWTKVPMRYLSHRLHTIKLHYFFHIFFALSMAKKPLCHLVNCMNTSQLHTWHKFSKLVWLHLHIHPYHFIGYTDPPHPTSCTWIYEYCLRLQRFNALVRVALTRQQLFLQIPLSMTTGKHCCTI